MRATNQVSPKATTTLSIWLSALPALPLAMALQACGGKPSTHETTQLVEESFVCDTDAARAAKLSAAYGTFLQGGSETHRKTAGEALSLIPREYLRWIFDRNAVPVTLREDSGSVRGMTTSQGSGDEWYPIEIWVAPKTGTFDPLPHELGHATEHYVNRTFPEFPDHLERTYQESALGEEGNYMRSYARSNSTEYFAELFDSYYCGEASRDNMRQKMPKSLALAEKYLIDPKKLDDGSTGDDSPRGRELEVDTDGDGVPNPYDLCASTPSGATVHFSRTYSGCSEGQVPH